MATIPDLVLASGSPRRRELLDGLGIDFRVRPVDLDESARDGEAPADLVLRLATEKAAANVGQGELVLAADTLVVLEGAILGKPEGEEDARAMLERIQGREHLVLTGIALLDGPNAKPATDVGTTRVRIGAMSSERIRWYVATGEPLDKAGSYAIQGLGATFVEGILGNYTNVVGLPIPALKRLFASLGYDLLSFRR